MILQKWNTGDIKTLAESANNPQIAANMKNSFPCPYTLENAKWYVNDCLENDGFNAAFSSKMRKKWNCA